VCKKKGSKSGERGRRVQNPSNVQHRGQKTWHKGGHKGWGNGEKLPFKNTRSPVGIAHPFQLTTAARLHQTTWGQRGRQQMRLDLTARPCLFTWGGAHTTRTEPGGMHARCQRWKWEAGKVKKTQKPGKHLIPLSSDSVRGRGAPGDKSKHTCIGLEINLKAKSRKFGFKESKCRQ